jgi:hypothetical protein
MFDQVAHRTTKQGRFPAIKNKIDILLGCGVIVQDIQSLALETKTGPSLSPAPMDHVLCCKGQK